MLNFKLGRCVVVLAWFGLAISSAFAQRQPASIERRSMWDDPQMRERFYNRAVDRYLQEMSQAYELTDEQRAQVAERLAQLKQEQVDYAERGRDEMSRVRDELGDLWRKQRAGQPVDQQKMDQLTARMREMWQGSPLMNPEKVAGEVERLLPAEQAGKGRPKWQAARQERLREWTDRFAVLGSRGGTLPGSQGNTDSWQRLVETFCSEFNLDEAQRASAFSVLRDVQARRDQYLASHASDVEATQEIDDFRLRRERMQELMKPIDSLYAELQSRLDKIPTSSQIEAVRARATTQPAGGGFGSVATRPSDMIRRPVPIMREPAGFRGPISRPEGK